jgi:hypothetical protein
MARTARVPRVGILVECGRDGLEVHLCRRICALLREQHGGVFEEEIIPMDNKRRLLEEAATVAQGLFEDGFDRVVILWDEVEFPTKSGHGVNGYSVRSYSAGETYPSEE